MTNGRPVDTRSALDTWLFTLGFQNNPFATNEADRERDLLPGFFVDVESYDLIKGDQSVIVFAPRGGGKSSLRVVLASYGAPWLSSSDTLTVECTDFDYLIGRWQQQHPLTIQEYVDWFLPMAVQSLFDTFFYNANVERVDAAIDTDRLARASKLTRQARLHLARLLHTYCPRQCRPERIGRLLSFYNPRFVIEDGLQFYQLVQHHRLRELMVNYYDDEEEDVLVRLLVDLVDFGAVASSVQSLSPNAQVKDFFELVEEAGFKAVHFLLDRLDETIETADDPEAQADIVEPLLSHLPTMEMPGVAFKFFLSQEARDALWERPTVRQEDRLAEYAVTLKWDEERLRQMLAERLRSYSTHPDTGNPQVSDLTAVCVEDTDESGPVGRKIEAAMISRAQGSPRRLIIAGRLLFEAHLYRHGGAGQLDWEDWLAAEKRLLQKFPPLLQINLDSQSYLLGGQIIHLSRQEKKIIQILVQAGGKCSRDDMAMALNNPSDGAMDQAMRRLREKLDDNVDDPVYIKTLRGEGFQLSKYELV